LSALRYLRHSLVLPRHTVRHHPTVKIKGNNFYYQPSRCRVSRGTPIASANHLLERHRIMAHCSRGESKANVDAMGKGGNHPAVSSRVHALISGGGENNFRRALCTAGYFLLSSTANIQQQSKSRAHHLLLLSAHLHLNRTLLSVPSPSR